MAADRLDEDRAPDTHAIGADLREAYERGRRDERSARRRHPIAMTATFVLTIVGLALLILAGVNGSFAGGGQVADQTLQSAVSRASPAVSQAADDAQARVADATHR
jgi:hypothetical protein